MDHCVSLRQSRHVHSAPFITGIPPYKTSIKTSCDTYDSVYISRPPTLTLLFLLVTS